MESFVKNSRAKRWIPEILADATTLHLVFPT